MRLICLNQDECGYIEELSDLSEQELVDFIKEPTNQTCNLCCSTALLYSLDHKPLIMFNSDQFSEISENMIAFIHNLISYSSEDENA